MKRVGPPRWMERLLDFLLSERDRETIAGDLYEEFCHNQSSKLSFLGASFWYLRQTASLAPRTMSSIALRIGTLPLVCTFTALCGIWLGAMDLRLRHPGYVSQAVIAVAILVQALLTLAALRLRQNAWLRYLSMLGCLGLLFLALEVLLNMARGADLEGYVVAIAMALVLQVVLTLRNLPGISGRAR